MIKMLMLALATSALLSGCATKYHDTTNWTQADWAAYNARVASNQAAMGELTQSMAKGNAQLQKQTETTLNQAQGYKAPEVANPAQPNSTAVIYCRDLTGKLIMCKQLN